MPIKDDILELKEMINSDIDAVGGIEDFNNCNYAVEVITSWIERIVEIIERMGKVGD